MYIYIYITTHTHTPTHSHSLSLSHTHTYTRTRTHTHIHTHAHTRGIIDPCVISELWRRDSGEDLLASQYLQQCMYTVNMYIYNSNTHIHTHSHTRKHTTSHTRTHTQSHTHTHTQSHTHTQTHTHTHTHTHASRRPIAASHRGRRRRRVKCPCRILRDSNFMSYSNQNFKMWIFFKVSILSPVQFGNFTFQNCFCKNSRFIPDFFVVSAASGLAQAGIAAMWGRCNVYI